MLCPLVATSRNNQYQSALRKIIKWGVKAIEKKQCEYLVFAFNICFRVMIFSQHIVLCLLLLQAHFILSTRRSRHQLCKQKDHLTLIFSPSILRMLSPKLAFACEPLRQLPGPHALLSEMIFPSSSSD